jgi:rare lipoprotein A (peptidoglycan hydrolase)
VHPETLSSLNGQRLAVKGQMYPRLPGRIVRLQGRRGEGWQTLATTSTGRGGRFTLRFTPTGGSRAMRVEFAGDRQNAKAATPAGSAASYQQAVASWYDDGGSTACGFHAYLGVANKSLPCGAHVTFSYGGRTVTATVDDRGPYVGGREFDLNQNTAAALGFGGVGTVAYSS